MLAALGTLAFLTALWLVVVTTARLLEDNGGKMLAALKGRSPLAVQPVLTPTPVRVSLRSRPSRPVHAKPRLRAAA